MQRVVLLPPTAGEGPDGPAPTQSRQGGDGGRAQAACGQTLHPHPRPLPSQGEGSLCAKLMGSDLAGAGLSDTGVSVAQSRHALEVLRYEIDEIFAG